MARSDVIGCTKGGATATVKLIFISNFLQSTIILQKQHVLVNQELHSVLCTANCLTPMGVIASVLRKQKTRL